ncbi:MAG: AAA family ATPase [Gemmatimonadetes bacterium]|nr:AAA family ATPase [Gemmatimonadota bacterium]
MIIDEVQHLPELFRTQRVLVDEAPSGRRFLILGSAAVELLHRSTESLAGRIAYNELPGFDLGEVGSARQDRLSVRGGFPRSFLARSEAESRGGAPPLLAHGRALPRAAMERLGTGTRIRRRAHHGPTVSRRALRDLHGAAARALVRAPRQATGALAPGPHPRQRHPPSTARRRGSRRPRERARAPRRASGRGVLLAHAGGRRTRPAGRAGPHEASSSSARRPQR